MKTKLSYLLIAAVLSTAALALAQEKKATPPPSREEIREQFKNMTPEERAAKMKEWREKQGTAPEGDSERRREAMQDASKQLGINPEELRNLTPEQRREKMNQAVEKKLAELNKKKADKTITAEETKLLQRLEARKKQMEQHKDAPPRRDGPPGHGKEHKDGAPGKSGEKGPEHKGRPEKKDKN